VARKDQHLCEECARCPHGSLRDPAISNCAAGAGQSSLSCHHAQNHAHRGARDFFEPRAGESIKAGNVHCSHMGACANFPQISCGLRCAMHAGKISLHSHEFGMHTRESAQVAPILSKNSFEAQHVHHSKTGAFANFPRIVREVRMCTARRREQPPCTASAALPHGNGSLRKKQMGIQNVHCAKARPASDPRVSVALHGETPDSASFPKNQSVHRLQARAASLHRKCSAPRRSMPNFRVNPESAPHAGESNLQAQNAYPRTWRQQSRDKISALPKRER
jgi:hypothetical protein